MSPDDIFQLVGLAAGLIRLFIHKSRVHFAMLGDKTIEIRFLQHSRTLQQIQEFANVTRIIISHQCRYLLFRKMFAKSAEPPVVGDLTNILFVFTQRRHTNLHDIKPHFFALGKPDPIQNATLPD